VGRTNRIIWNVKMIKNLKDLIIVALVIGVLSLLGLIIVGDYYVALQENRPVDESVITLMKMALTGLIGIIAGYIGGK
jgi:hypothetical protein